MKSTIDFSGLSTMRERFRMLTASILGNSCDYGWYHVILYAHEFFSMTMA